MKLSVVIWKDLHVNIYVHRTLISDSHMSGVNFHDMPSQQLMQSREKLENYGVCMGNPDEETQMKSSQIWYRRDADCHMQHWKRFWYSKKGILMLFREIWNTVIQYNYKNVNFLMKEQDVCSGYRRLLRERKCRIEKQNKR